MNYRTLGRTGWKVSEISFGAWAIGSAWGAVDDDESLAALHKSIDLGVNFIDTADVYGDGRSERLVAALKKKRPETIYVATKAGRYFMMVFFGATFAYTVMSRVALLIGRLEFLLGDWLGLLRS